MHDKVERVAHEGRLICLIVRSDFQKDGIEFFTSPDMSQQLAYMKHDKGKTILPHLHRKTERQINLTQEVLIVKRGKVMVSLYTEAKAHLCDKVLFDGDVILLASGGHGFRFLEVTEMIEVKQGPYVAENDKERFNP